MVSNINQTGACFNLLWTNPNPLAEFGEQDVSVDLSGYKAIMIDFYEYNGNSERLILTPLICMIGEEKSYTVLCEYVDQTASKVEGFSSRLVRIPGNSYVRFGKAYNMVNEQNRQCVPVHIYGLK